MSYELWNEVAETKIKLTKNRLFPITKKGLKGGNVRFLDLLFLT